MVSSIIATSLGFMGGVIATHFFYGDVLDLGRWVYEKADKDYNKACELLKKLKADL